MSIKEAFFDKCREAKPAKRVFISLYVNVPFYGGPEEGGWWGNDCKLIAYQEVATVEEAEALEAAIQALANEATKESQQTSDRQCLREMEWLDARGLEPDYLPEVDGGCTFWVSAEDRPGKHEQQGCRHYE